MNNSIFECGGNFYGAVALNPSTLVRYSTSEENWSEILSFHQELASDDYVRYLDIFYRMCLQRFGQAWCYLDITNVLYASAKLVKPQNYLEIGVRRGRSICTVVRGCPQVNIVAVDMWMKDYAGMENPGPAFVKEELEKHGHLGTVRFIDGDSHVVLPEYFRTYPNQMFDLITVDGDHSEKGAWEDLCVVIPHLALGGVLVFDDIAHPDHKYLADVWEKSMLENMQLSSFEYTEAGYGVAIAIRVR